MLDGGLVNEGISRIILGYNLILIIATLGVILVLAMKKKYDIKYQA
jgi:hypothetical protein